MDEYISKTKFEELMRKKARNNFDLYYADKSKHYYDNAIGYNKAADEAYVFPSADVQLVIHAYWIELPKALNPNENPCKCSNCGHILSFMNGYPKSKYCDECGAKMDIIYEDDKIRAIKATGWNNDARDLTDKETDIYNNRLEAEAETIYGISLL